MTSDLVGTAVDALKDPKDERLPRILAVVRGIHAGAESVLLLLQTVEHLRGSGVPFDVLTMRQYGGQLLIRDASKCRIPSRDRVLEALAARTPTP